MNLLEQNIEGLKKFFLLTKEQLSSLNGNQSIIDLYNKDINEIVEAYDLFADDFSKRTYLKNVFFYIFNDLLSEDVAHQLADHWSDEEELNYAKKNVAKSDIDFHIFQIDSLTEETIMLCFSNIFCKEQYRYKGEFLNDPIDIKPKVGSICIDAGGFIGDTATWMVKKCNVQKVFSFEFMPHLVDVYKKVLDVTNLGDKIKIVQKGLADCDSEMYVRRVHDAADQLILNYDKYVAKYGSDNLSKVEVTSIDKFCSENSVIPDFIKMDIEGAEALALIGARETIKKYKPTLAISAYHKVEDNYKLPLLIKSLNKDYKFYMQRAYRTCETVLFAV